MPSAVSAKAPAMIAINVDGRLALAFDLVIANHVSAGRLAPRARSPTTWNDSSGSASSSTERNVTRCCRPAMGCSGLRRSSSPSISALPTGAHAPAQAGLTREVARQESCLLEG
jgi:hypothetical protein